MIIILFIILLMGGCMAPKIEHFDAHVFDWVDDIVTERAWRDVQMHKTWGPQSICDEAVDNHIRSLTLQEFRRQRAADLIWQVREACMCGEVASVNCIPVWINHPAYAWPSTWQEPTP